MQIGIPEKKPNSYFISTKSKGKKKEKLLREVIVKIKLKQKDNKEEIVIEMLLDSRVTGLVMNSEFIRKYKFKKKNWIGQYM